MALLEVCVDSLAGLDAAERGGADRIELCSRLDLGGLSPDRELLEAALGSTRLPLHVMVRTRPGDFVYAKEEVASMEKEVLSLRDLAIAGVVLGALTAERNVDSATVSRLLAAARPMSLTFHRAFDEASDSRIALEELIRLGVDRILTSGGAPNAFQGRDRLRQLVLLARGRILVMAGGGVRPENAAAILMDAGVAELHGSVPFRLPPPGSLESGS